MLLPPTSSTLFPYTTLFRSVRIVEVRVVDRAVVEAGADERVGIHRGETVGGVVLVQAAVGVRAIHVAAVGARSEEHTSELQSRRDLVCRLLLEKKNKRMLTS